MIIFTVFFFCNVLFCSKSLDLCQLCNFINTIKINILKFFYVQNFLWHFLSFLLVLVNKLYKLFSQNNISLQTCNILNFYPLFVIKNLLRLLCPYFCNKYWIINSNLKLFIRILAYIFCIQIIHWTFIINNFDLIIYTFICMTLHNFF